LVALPLAAWRFGVAPENRQWLIVTPLVLLAHGVLLWLMVQNRWVALSGVNVPVFAPIIASVIMMQPDVDKPQSTAISVPTPKVSPKAAPEAAPVVALGVDRVQRSTPWFNTDTVPTLRGRIDAPFAAPQVETLVVIKEKPLEPTPPPVTAPLPLPKMEPVAEPARTVVVTPAPVIVPVPVPVPVPVIVAMPPVVIPASAPTAAPVATPAVVQAIAPPVASIAPPSAVRVVESVSTNAVDRKGTGEVPNVLTNAPAKAASKAADPVETGSGNARSAPEAGDGKSGSVFGLGAATPPPAPPPQPPPPKVELPPASPPVAVASAPSTISTAPAPLPKVLNLNLGRGDVVRSGNGPVRQLNFSELANAQLRRGDTPDPMAQAINKAESADCLKADEKSQVTGLLAAPGLLLKGAAGKCK
jgi:hypothetical protein